MRMLACLLFLLIILPITGCTKRSMYEGLKNYQQMDCDKLLGREREECVRQSGMSYDEYQRQLKEREK